MNGVTLVTGANGFTGRHLVTMLQGRAGWEVAATSRRSGTGTQSCDLTDNEQVRELIETLQPSQIIHCAGSFDNVWETDFLMNVESTRHLLDAIRLRNPGCRVLLIGSAAEYGNTTAGAIAETAPLNPVTIYGMTKAMQSMLMDFYVRSSGMDIVMARTFNLYGAGCSPALFPGRVNEQIELVRNGLQKTIRVRSLEARRDYLPIGEAIEAYVRILEHGRSGEVYNVGSGTPVKMSNLLQQLLQPAGLSMSDVEVVPDGEGTKAGVPDSFADIQKLRQLPASEAR